MGRSRRGGSVDAALARGRGNVLALFHSYSLRESAIRSVVCVVTATTACALERKPCGSTLTAVPSKRGCGQKSLTASDVIAIALTVGAGRSSLNGLSSSPACEIRHVPIAAPGRARRKSRKSASRARGPRTVAHGEAMPPRAKSRITPSVGAAIPSSSSNALSADEDALVRSSSGGDHVAAAAHCARARASACRFARAPSI